MEMIGAGAGFEPAPYQERILSPFSFNGTTRDHAVFTGVPPVKAS